MQHQCSRSSSGSRMSLATRAMTSLSRRPSQGSQEQLPINEQQQQQQPQIRTFDPDGRHHNHELLHAASSYPPSRGSRSPSPVRAASLDARCSSPLGQQASLLSAAQLAASQPGLASASSSQAASPAPRSPAARCLSPLMIPSPRASFSLSTDGGLPPASPLGALQPDLYQRRDQPLFLSRGSGKSLGRLRLRLSYDFDKSDLDVHLVEASELAGGEHGGFQDPYVKLSLSPEVDARKRQTGVHHNEANPRFDQHFKFPVSQDELQDKTLLLQVLDDDRFSRNDVVGSLRVALDGLDISSRGGVELWGEVSRERKPPEEKQEVCLSLSYLPQAGRLAMTLHKARNLFPLPGKQSLDAFVKVGLISGEKRVKKKKTSVRKATRCPDWNEAFTFSVAQSALATSAIEICVLDSSSQESSSGHAVIGSCIVGPGLGQAGLDSGTSNPSVEHWQLMIQSPRENITMWHTLH
uniref:C2 domain-containing protein n=1 Tax=Trichogramma kaykai TaxID=54128 RepID=A0ABD2X9Q3_9HYME